MTSRHKIPRIGNAVVKNNCSIWIMQSKLLKELRTIMDESRVQSRLCNTSSSVIRKAYEQLPNKKEAIKVLMKKYKRHEK